MTNPKYAEIKSDILPLRNHFHNDFITIPILFGESQFLKKELISLLSNKIIIIPIEEYFSEQPDSLMDWLMNFSFEGKSDFNFLLNNPENYYPYGVIFISETFFVNNVENLSKFYYNIKKGEFFIVIVLEKENTSFDDFTKINDYIYSFILKIQNHKSHEIYAKFILNTINALKLQIENFHLETKLEIAHKEMSRIIRIGQLLSNEKNLDIILDTILKEAMEMVSADGGSIYITETDDKLYQKEKKFLRFKTSALNLRKNEFILPIDSSSIAGYVALSGEPLIIDDVYALRGDEPYRFNPEYDIQHHYLTRSMLVIPMKNYQNETIGVIQLINKRKDPYRKLTYEEMKKGEVLPFTQECMKKILALAGQAAVAIENHKLIQSIHNLFEGFVRASVIAIEQRDPTTSGHSFRVAEYTLALANAVNKTHTGKYKDLYFTEEQLKEIRYAALLHDFGKVGVREKVLVKEKKLYSEQLNEIQWRFKYAIRSLEYEYTQKKLDYIKKNGLTGFNDFEKFLDFELEIRIEELKEMLSLIEQSNEPNTIEKEVFSNLDKISKSKLTIQNRKHTEIIEFLKENELVSLMVRRGNLDPQERLEIESHVSHTYKFLIQIPWTKDLKLVPDIAHGHHEKLDGSGYPLGLKGEEILPQTRILTIADIFDALVAPDRPYKKSIPKEQALDILKIEAKEGRIDSDLLDIFIESKAYEISFSNP
ncbi:MAG: GAF domain-containing protein [Leptospiraceae bacterium]|nr:GAF domain-containing protein [Leptospiraceae bacterium]MDW7976954.1 HD domain-containing phosphohydrolase [Leptospiraceae bacterium]